MPPARSTDGPSTPRTRTTSGLVRVGATTPTVYARPIASRPFSDRITRINGPIRRNPSPPPYQQECARLKIPCLHMMQQLVIDQIVATPGEDQFIIAATGSGKSLLYELPAILPQASGKVTIVFIPRVAIIRTELQRLKSCGIKAEARYKMNTPESMEESMDQNRRLADGLRNPSALPAIFLVTPNQLEYHESNFQRVLVGLCERGLVNRFVFDEVHMLLNNVDTLAQLPKLRDKFPEIPVTILSASLSPSTATNLCRGMSISRQPHMFPLDRPNLYYQVLPKQSSGEDMKDESAPPTEKELSQIVPIVHLATNTYPQGAGLVYCRTKKWGKRLARLLSEKGVPAHAYDSELGNTPTGAVAFNKWVKNDPEVRVLVSTNALSSGVHKSDVRFVVHASLPTSGMDGYMQETGRAGRDGLNSTCLLLYSFGDAFIVPQLTMYETDNILSLLRLVNSHECRRRSLLSYYGDKHFNYTKPSGRCCDVCDGTTERRPSLDVTHVASRLLQFCEDQGGLLAGRKTLAQKMQRKFPVAALKELSQDMWDNMIQWLVIERYLVVDRPGERGGGQLKVVKCRRTNNLLQLGGQKVYLPWPMRFNELNVRGVSDHFPLRWTEALAQKFIAGEDSERSSSPEI
ncbi:P-loop containing nucleoside triphosphate hydrolase protein [Ceratobasidium sp. AG-I]|nr:P-loop containing nucleoside triphosphate hydrolase protein [Ceratobasidium sp. AG-I]